MLKLVSLFAVSLLLAGEAGATCTLNPDFADPQIYTIPGAVIHVNADAANNTSMPIATYDSPSSGLQISYVDCAIGEAYGKAVINLYNQNTTTKIFPTKVPGIGIKVKWNNGENFGNFPSLTIMDNEGVDGGFMFSYPPNSFFRIEFYKIADKVTLTNMDGDEVLTPGDIAYNWIIAPVPANYVQKLIIGSIKIVSTPVCTVDDAKTIDFGTVTPAMVSAGVERDLDFKLTCTTDYGSYAASASVITATPSQDATYIKVTDAGNNSDNLGIQILNGSGKIMTVNGTILEKIASTMSNNTALFSWKAKLIGVASGSSRPHNGQFTARAEIVLDIN